MGRSATGMWGEREAEEVEEEVGTAQAAGGGVPVSRGPEEEEEEGEAEDHDMPSGKEEARSVGEVGGGASSLLSKRSIVWSSLFSVCHRQNGTPCGDCDSSSVCIDPPAPPQAYAASGTAVRGGGTVDGVGCLHSEMTVSRENGTRRASDAKEKEEEAETEKGTPGCEGGRGTVEAPWTRPVAFSTHDAVCISVVEECPRRSSVHAPNATGAVGERRKEPEGRTAVERRGGSDDSTNTRRCHSMFG